MLELPIKTLQQEQSPMSEVDYAQMIKDREGLTKDDLMHEIALRIAISLEKIAGTVMRAQAGSIRTKLLNDPEAVKADLKAQGINPRIVDLVLPDLLATTQSPL